jgi:hypothetical protein
MTAPMDGGVFAPMNGSVLLSSFLRHKGRKRPCRVNSGYGPGTLWVALRVGARDDNKTAPFMGAN